MHGLRRLSILGLLLFVHFSAAAAVLDGVTMPDTQDIAGAHLVLNGLGLRTYSILRVRIYVAGLYLEQRSPDANAILGSMQPKLLRFVFLRDVDAETAQKSWRTTLERNCPAPCSVPADRIERFIAAVPSVREGDTNMLVFSARGMDVLINGRFAGRVNDPALATLILTTFIGQHPVSEELKTRLLGTSG